MHRIMSPKYILLYINNGQMLTPGGGVKMPRPILNTYEINMVARAGAKSMQM